MDWFVINKKQKMKCSPKIKGSRVEAGMICNEKCWYFEECKKEMGMSKDWKTPKWKKILATDEDIKNGLYFEERKKTRKKASIKDLALKNFYYWKKGNKICKIIDDKFKWVLTQKR